MKHFIWILIIPMVVYAQEEWGHHPPTDAEFNAISDETAYHPGSLVVEKDLYARNVIIGGIVLDASGVIYASTSTVYLTDDRGPGWWLADSEVFSASLTYRTRLLEQIKVNGYSWPLVMDGDHIAYQYRDDDSTMIAGFTIRRTAAMTAMAERNCRVEWTYLSSEFEPDAEVANGLWPVRGEPQGAVLNGVGAL